MRKTMAIPAILLTAVFLMGAKDGGGCASDADRMSQNAATKSEQFEVYRKIQFYNSILGEVMLLVEGFCSVEFEPEYFEVGCLTPEREYLKHLMGRSDNTLPIVEQLEAVKVDPDRYLMIIKPFALIPDLQLVTPTTRANGDVVYEKTQEALDREAAAKEREEDLKEVQGE